ncbi:hypothetical protein [Limnobaculum xujianqingii]|uniref:hypothetical protein n=1 Tax=Limnobaculum xujianqingii TaxID=2738837 RepID=UPI00112683F4|nr:hypothetical protein [Limnobaculum xujianqingii]
MSRKPISLEEQAAYTLAVIRLMHHASLTYVAACKHLTDIINEGMPDNVDILFKEIDILIFSNQYVDRKIKLNTIEDRCNSNIGIFIKERLIKKETVLVGSHETVCLGYFPGEDNYKKTKETTAQYLDRITKIREIEQEAIDELEKTLGPSSVPYLRDNDGRIKNLVMPDEDYNRLRKNAGRESSPSAPVVRHYRIIESLLFYPVSFFVNLYKREQERKNIV